MALVVLLPLGTALAQERIVLDETRDVYHPGLQLEVMEDAEGRLTIFDVSAPAMSGNFKPSTQEIPNFGLTDATYWFRFDLIYRPQDPFVVEKEWLLRIAYPPLDRIHLYLSQPGDAWLEHQGGDLLPFWKREVKHHHYIFPLRLKPGVAYQVYLKVHTESSLQVPLSIWKPSAFLEHVNDEQLGFGFYYGAMLVMAIYNLFLFFTVRDINYLYITLFILSFSFFQMSLDGYAAEFLWSNNIFLINRGIPFFISLSTIFAMCFTRFLLRTAKFLPKLDRLLLLIVIADTGVLCLSVFASYALAILIAICLTFAAAGSALVSGIASVFTGFRPARFFLAAWTAFLIGVILYVLKTVGILPFTVLTNYAPQFGSALMVTLLSISLGDRINMERKAKFQAQKEVFAAQQRSMQDFKKAQEMMKSAKEAAETANRTKSDFMANMSHELRTPLNGIIGATDLALEEQSPFKVNRYLKTIRSSGATLMTLINDLLDFSRIDTGNFVLAHDPFQLDELLENMASVFAVRAARQKIELMLDLEPGMPVHLMGDGIRLQKILINLLENAIKFTDKGGEILIGAQLRSRLGNRLEYLLYVSDTGMGIAPEDLDGLFESFTQGDTSSSRKHEGVGIGLCFVKHIVKMLDGEIWVESEPGKGSTFYVTVRFDLQPDAHPKPVMNPTEFKGKRVVVVIEKPAHALIVDNLLAAYGFDVRHVPSDNNLILGPDVDQARDADLLMIDSALSFAPWLDVCRQIRDGAAKPLPCIVMVPFGMHPEDRKAACDDHFDVVTKPILTGLLDEVLRRQLLCEMPVPAPSGLPKSVESRPAFQETRVTSGSPEKFTAVLAKLRSALRDADPQAVEAQIDLLQPLAADRRIEELIDMAANYEYDEALRLADEIWKELDTR